MRCADAGLLWRKLQQLRHFVSVARLVRRRPRQRGECQQEIARSVKRRRRESLSAKARGKQRAMSNTSPPVNTGGSASASAESDSSAVASEVLATIATGGLARDGAMDVKVSVEEEEEEEGWFSWMW